MAKRRRARRGNSGGYRISHGGAYRMTPKRRAALKKAQLASARKRKRGLSTRAKVGITGTVALGAVLGAGIVRHKISGSQLDISIGRGRKGEIVPSRPDHHMPSKNHYLAHGNNPHQILQRGPGRRDSLSVHHSTRRVQDRRDPHIAMSGGVQLTSTGTTPFRNEHIFGASIPGIGRIGVRYQHRGATSSQLSNVIFGKKTKSGGSPPQASGVASKHTTPLPRHLTQHHRDGIPYKKPGTAQWPIGTEEDARKLAQGLRAGTHYLHPKKGVTPFPESARGRKMVESKIAKWMLGQDRGILPKDWWD